MIWHTWSEERTNLREENFFFFLRNYCNLSYSLVQFLNFIGGEKKWFAIGHFYRFLFQFKNLHLFKSSSCKLN